MQDTNTGTLGDLLSDGREDIEFGTVSEILKVSSSIQSESATYAEAASVKIESSIDKTSCTNFELIRSKKIKRTSKRIEKPIVSFNKFEILEHEDLQVEETAHLAQERRASRAPIRSSNTRRRADEENKRSRRTFGKRQRAEV